MNNDRTLDDAEPDRTLGGDVQGNGIVSRNDTLSPAPPATKALSNRGRQALLGGLTAISAAVVIGILLAGGNQGAGGDAAASAGAVATAPAPDVARLAGEQQQSAAAGAAPLREPGQGPGAGPGPGAGAGQGPSGPGPGPGAGAPSHSAQFADWRTKHAYDQKRAALIAAQQARVAQMVGQSSGAGAAGGAGGGLAMSAQQMPQMQQMQQQMQMAQQQAQQARAAAMAMPAMPGGMPGAMAGAMPTMAGSMPGAMPGAMPAMAGAAGADQDVQVGYLDERVRPQAAQHEISAGTIIPAVMLTGINSELPGTIVAQVRSNVFDTFDFRKLLIPQGSRLIGRYSSEIQAGQQRVLVAWDELIFPNGNRISLQAMPGTDTTGAAGLNDQVHTHFWRTWGNALLVSLIGAATQATQPQQQNNNQTPGGTQQAIGAVGGSLNETAQQVLRRNLNISPTLIIRPGYTFNVLVNQSVVLPVYRERDRHAR